MQNLDYPVWICTPCGVKLGNKIPNIATYHLGICDVCGKEDAVTEPRDFGHLKDGWEKHVKKEQND